MPYTYDYPRPMLTVDVFLIRLHTNRFEVLLIQRKNDPFKGQWALPGGYVDIDEPLEEAAKRELREETGIENIPLFKLDVFGDPGRDPRGRTITVVYFGAIPPEFNKLAKAADDAAEAKWFSLTHLPALAFDHDRIIETCLDKFKSNLSLRFWFLLFVGDTFSAEELSQFVNLMESKFAEGKIETTLLNLPFLKRGKKDLFQKVISNEDLLKMSDADFGAILASI